MVTVTISGTPGSGKTTVGKLLADKLGLEYVYSGMIFREMAQKYKMSLEEFGSYAENHREIDQELDDFQLTVLRKGNIVIEGRITGWIAFRNKIPSIKVLIDANLETRARRIVKRERGSIEKRKKEILKREKSEYTRYRNYYNINLDDTSIYDIVIDSSNKTPEEITKIILRKIRK